MYNPIKKLPNRTGKQRAEKFTFAHQSASLEHIVPLFPHFRK